MLHGGLNARLVEAPAPTGVVGPRPQVSAQVRRAGERQHVLRSERKLNMPLQPLGFIGAGGVIEEMHSKHLL
jgi:hypothetical protein